MSKLVTERDRASNLVFDWNEVNRRGRILPRNASFFDETLRDGLQNPSVIDPGIEEKLAILHLMEDLGIHVVDVGLPGSSERAFDDVLRLCKEIVDCKMNIEVACAGRTVVSDITPMIEISQRTGLPIEVYAFIGSSPIRQYVEDWDVALRAAGLLGVNSTPELTAIYRHWENSQTSYTSHSGNEWQEATDRVRNRMQNAPFLMPANTYDDLVETVERERRLLAEMLDSTFWRATEPFRRGVARVRRFRSKDR